MKKPNYLQKLPIKDGVSLHSLSIHKRSELIFKVFLGLIFSLFLIIFGIQSFFTDKLQGTLLFGLGALIIFFEIRALRKRKWMDIWLGNFSGG